MSSLPPRFPRASLVDNATRLELRLSEWIERTNERIDESENLGLGQVTHRLNLRLQALQDARDIAAELASVLFSRL